MKFLKSKKLAAATVLAATIASASVYAGCVEPAWCGLVGGVSPQCICANK